MTLYAPASTASAWRMMGKRFLCSPLFIVAATAVTAIATVPQHYYTSNAALPPQESLDASSGQILVAAHPLADYAPSHERNDEARAAPVQLATYAFDELSQTEFLPAATNINFVTPSPLNEPDTRWGALGTSLLLRLPDPAQVTIRAPSLVVPPPLDESIGRELLLSPLTDLPDGPEIVTVRARGGELLGDVLDAQGVDPDDRRATLVALRADDIAELMNVGDAIDLAMEAGATGYNRLVAIRLRVKGRREVELHWDDKVEDIWASLAIETRDPSNDEISYRPVSLVEALGESALRMGEPDRVFLQGEIKTTLYDAAEEADMTPGETRTLAEIFRYMIDFERDLRVGDRFEVMFEKKENGDYGDILYASIENRGKRISLFRGEITPGVFEYFDENGKTNKRALMRTPLAYGRISSSYGMRRHPILGYQKMHRGVDFAAPQGTPILAAGDGVIDYIGRRGGYGKYIRIRHANDHKTAYAHMSRFADLRRGDRIKQGTVIGYVGSTGRSTGPHLHFEVLRGKEQINPTSIADFGALKALEGPALARFMANIARLNLMLAALRPHTIVAEAR